MKRLLASFAFASAATLVPLVAHATTLTITNPTALPRTNAAGEPVTKRVLTPEGVSYRDCADDLRLVLPLTATELDAGDRLELWVAPSGIDCTAPANRAGAFGTCGLVQANVSRTVSQSVPVPFRTMLAATTTGSAFPQTEATVCGKVDRSTFTLQVLALDSEGQAKASASVPVSVDTVGGPPPSAVVTAGAEGLRVESSVAGADEDRTGLNFYCTPTAATEEGACSAALLGHEEFPGAAFDGRFLCSSVSGPTANTGSIRTTADGDALVAGTTYAVAAASVDSFGNLGGLSTPSCTEAAGAGADPDLEAGGCTVSTTPASGSVSASLLTVAVAAALALVRRTRRAGRRTA